MTSLSRCCATQATRRLNPHVIHRTNAMQRNTCPPGPPSAIYIPRRTRVVVSCPQTAKLPRLCGRRYETLLISAKVSFPYEGHPPEWSRPSQCGNQKQNLLHPSMLGVEGTQNGPRICCHKLLEWSIIIQINFV